MERDFLFMWVRLKTTKDERVLFYLVWVWPGFVCTQATTMHRWVSTLFIGLGHFYPSFTPGFIIFTPLAFPPRLHLAAPWHLCVFSPTFHILSVFPLSCRSQSWMKSYDSVFLPSTALYFTMKVSVKRLEWFIHLMSAFELHLSKRCIP